nr:MAG TPA: hypothetical protein [Caudoviricetes sp.]
MLARWSRSRLRREGWVRLRTSAPRSARWPWWSRTTG